MNITKREENGTVTFMLEGWLDTLSAPELDKAINGVEEASAIILDFDGVEYIASSGLREVVACHRKAKELDAAFSVINAGTETMSIFELTGIDKKMDIRKKDEKRCEDSEDTASENREKEDEEITEKTL